MNWRKWIAQRLDPPPPLPPEPPWPPVVISDYPYEPTSRYGHGQPPHALLHALLDRNRPQYRKALSAIRDLEPFFLEVPVEIDPAGDPSSPVWKNDFLPGYDAAALWWHLLESRPRTYLEIGSGNSTKFARHAIRRHQLSTRIVSIDPHPRAEVDALCDRVIRQPVEKTDLALFEQLEPGDILFVDHSHRSFMGSDATVVFLDILPRLRPGVLVQVHDIYLPWDYPPDWKTRFFNEQYLLACLLFARQPAVEVRFPAVFVSTDPELSEVLKPLWTNPRFGEVGFHGVPPFADHGVSFWLEWKGLGA